VLIAVMPEAGYEIRKVHPPGVASAPTSGFVPAVVCNEFVFVAGQMAHNALAGVDPRAIVPEHAAWAGVPIRKQTEFLILEKLEHNRLDRNRAKAPAILPSFPRKRESRSRPSYSCPGPPLSRG
jgi:hypothetical protein